MENMTAVERQNAIFGPPEPPPPEPPFSGILNHPFVQALPGMAAQGANLWNQGVNALQNLPQHTIEPAADEAKRLLMMEQARQRYERNLGAPAPGGASMSWNGNPGYSDGLLARLNQYQKGR